MKEFRLQNSSRIFHRAFGHLEEMLSVKCGTDRIWNIELNVNFSRRTK